jgi:hypothetical protein
VKKPKSTWPPQLTPAEIERTVASTLLFGIAHLDGKHEFPSPNTSPTEKEARQALARILRSGEAPTYFLKALADQIDPDGRQFRLRRIEFKNLSQGHPRKLAKFVIANRVRDLRKKNEKNAIEKVAKEFGIHHRSVSRIWSELREHCEYIERLRKGDTSSRTDVSDIR